MLAGTSGVAAFEGDGAVGGAGEVAACVAIYAPTQLYVPDQPLAPRLSFLFGRDYTPEVARAASPIEYASASFPPTMLVHGNKDELVPVEASFRMYRALIEAGGRADLHVYDGAPHAFDRVPEFGRQVAAAIDLFLDRHVVNPRSVSVPAAAAAATS
jgi:dipeptidyl aminopeptidase/acylaminoacyl peptidase